MTLDEVHVFLLRRFPWLARAGAKERQLSSFVKWLHAEMLEKDRVSQECYELKQQAEATNQALQGFATICVNIARAGREAAAAPGEDNTLLVRLHVRTVEEAADIGTHLLTEEAFKKMKEEG